MNKFTLTDSITISKKGINGKSPEEYKKQWEEMNSYSIEIFPAKFFSYNSVNKLLGSIFMSLDDKDTIRLPKAERLADFITDLHYTVLDSSNNLNVNHPLYVKQRPPYTFGYCERFNNIILPKFQSADVKLLNKGLKQIPMPKNPKDLKPYFLCNIILPKVKADIDKHCAQSSISKRLVKRHNQTDCMLSYATGETSGDIKTKLSVAALMLAYKTVKDGNINVNRYETFWEELKRLTGSRSNISTDDIFKSSINYIRREMRRDNNISINKESLLIDL